MEAEWMKQIPNSSLCNFFYFFFVVYAIIFTLSIITLIATFVSVKVSSPMTTALLANGIITSVIAGTVMLFHYLICDRALLAKDVKPSVHHLH
jgi:hypothetical protein